MITEEQYLLLHAKLVECKFELVNGQYFEEAAILRDAADRFKKAYLTDKAKLEEEQRCSKS
jgi:hypothetical protein